MSKKFLILISFISLTLNAAQPYHFHDKNISESGLRGTSKLSLTFDDGPASNSTNNILDSLKLYNDNGFDIQATFFVVGRLAAKPNGLKALERIKNEGHIIASHSYSHEDLAKKLYSSPEYLFHETLDVHKVIKEFLPEVTDLNHKWYFRAPYGSWRAQRAQTLNAHQELKNYVGPIGWDIGSWNKYENGKMVRAADWQCWSKGVSIANCALGYIREAQEKDGGVVLLHDIHGKTAEMFKYLLVTWTGVNLFDDEKYEIHINQQPYGMDFVSLDNLEAYDQYDDRLIETILETSEEEQDHNH